MKGKAGVRLFLHQSCLYHLTAAAAVFLCRLEHQLYLSVPALSGAEKKLSHGQEIGRMDVVAAGVHDPGDLGAKGKPCFFLDRKGIHIGSQHQELTRASAVNDSDDPRLLGALFIRDPNAVQLPHHQLARFKFLEGQLRALMDLMAQTEGLLLQLIRQADQLFL